MGIIGKDFNYKLVKKFLTKEEVKLLNKYCEIKHRTNVVSFDPRNNVEDTYNYGDPLFDSMLTVKQSLIEKIVGYKLLPTYSYWRMYTKYSTLTKHVDRPSCEISATINIGGDGSTEWPIYMNKTPVYMKPGDAAVYLGAKIPHYRKEFKGDWSAQVFLHYVKKDGVHKNEYMDRRPYWGFQPNELTIAPIARKDNK